MLLNFYENVKTFLHLCSEPHNLLVSTAMRRKHASRQCGVEAHMFFIKTIIIIIIIINEND